MKSDPSWFTRLKPGAKETLKNDLNHEWTRINTNGNRLLAQVIRVDSCPFVVKSALP